MRIVTTGSRGFGKSTMYRIWARLSALQREAFDSGDMELFEWYRGGQHALFLAYAGQPFELPPAFNQQEKQNGRH